MTPRLWALSVAPVLAASSAYAQAPGEMTPYSAPPSYYAPTPPPANPCAYSQSPVMAHRWSIGLSIGRMGVAPADAPEGSEAEFSVGQLALRYRMTRRLELELTLGGGRQVLEDDVEGDLAAGGGTLALRFRFRPEQRWNWYLMAGFGATVIAPHESTEAEREGATRGHGMLGVGLERRFRRFALNAELRAVGMGPREDTMDKDDPVAGPVMPQPRLPGNLATTHAEELEGSQFTIGVSYYF